MVKRNTIPPRSDQIEGDGRGSRRQKKEPVPNSAREGETPLEREQRKQRDKTFGREQGGNQQGNQRGIGHPGDR
jgi:hypothetical protein